MLETLQAALAALTERCYHYFVESNAEPSYIVWAEDGDNDLAANNGHGECSYTGTIDLYTKLESDPLLASIPQALEQIGASYYLNSVQYEEETGLIHYEWVFGVV